MTLEEATAAVKRMHEVQGRDGIWNQDPYMCGMFNGLELTLAILEDRKPHYRIMRNDSSEPEHNQS